MTQTVPATAVLGPGKTGLTIGYRVLNLDGTTYSAFSTTGVAETSVAGTYRKTGGVVCPDAGAYIVWGVSGTDYAEATVDSTSANVTLWKGVTINDLVDGNVVVKLADVAHGGSAATLNLKKLSLINPTDNDPALYLEARHTPVVQSYAPLTAMGRYGWEISDGMFAALYPALVTEETLRSNLRIVKGALSDPVGMTATVDQDLYGTDAYVGWMLFLEYLDRGLNRWAAKVVSHTATTITLDDMIPGAGTFWLLPATGLSAQQTRDAMKLAPTAGAPAAGSVDAHLDALALEATAQAILEDTGTTLPAAVADAVWATALPGAYGAGTAGKLLSDLPSAGAGAIAHTITVDDGTNPLDGAEVWISTDEAGSNVVAGTLSTDALGRVTFMLDAGTYWKHVQLAGYNFTAKAFTVA